MKKEGKNASGTNRSDGSGKVRVRHLTRIAAAVLVFHFAAGCSGCHDVALTGDAGERDQAREDIPVMDPTGEPEPDLSEETLLDPPWEDITIEDAAQEDLPADEIEDLPPRYWARSFGIGGDELAWSILQTRSGEFIVSGRTEYSSPIDYNVWVLKLDREGEVLAQKTYGGEVSGRPRSIMQTEDGGFIFAGWITSIGPGYNDVFIVKVDLNLEIDWQRAYGSSANDYAESIEQTSDGGFILSGMSDSRWDLMVLKIDRHGNKEWQKKYGGEYDDFAMSIHQTPDGGYITAGGTYSFGAGSGDLWVLKLDAGGNIEWQKTYGGEGYEIAHELQRTEDGGYVLAGYTASTARERTHFFVLKIDENGSIQWQKAYAVNDYEAAYSIDQTSDGGYILAGDIGFSEDGYHDILVLRLDAGGNMVWHKTYGGEENDLARSIRQAMDGGFIMAGYSESFGEGDIDFWILKTDSEGIISDTCPPGIAVEASVEAIETAFSPSETNVIPQPMNDAAQDISFSSMDTDAAVETQCGR